MERTFTRDDVRLLLAQHRQRLLRAQKDGNFLAVAHDVTDELNDALAYLAERHGMDEVYRFKWLYAEAQRTEEWSRRLRCVDCAFRSRAVARCGSSAIVATHHAVKKSLHSRISAASARLSAIASAV